MNKDYYNGAGYADPTAYEAILSVLMEDWRQRERDRMLQRENESISAQAARISKNRSPTTMWSDAYGISILE